MSSHIKCCSSVGVGDRHVLSMILHIRPITCGVGRVSDGGQSATGC